MMRLLRTFYTVITGLPMPIVAHRAADECDHDHVMYFAPELFVETILIENIGGHELELTGFHGVANDREALRPSPKYRVGRESPSGRISRRGMALSNVAA